MAVKTWTGLGLPSLSDEIVFGGAAAPEENEIIVQVPCPNGIPGCLVAHFERRKKTLTADTPAVVEGKPL